MSAELQNMTSLLKKLESLLELDFSMYQQRYFGFVFVHVNQLFRPEMILERKKMFHGTAGNQWRS